MSRVFISRSLEVEIGSTYAMELAVDFRRFIEGQTKPGTIFGKNVPFSWPAQVKQQDLWHVHLETEEVRAKWALNRAKSRSPDRFTSNTILVYGRLSDLQGQPYLLHAILDPEGHKKMDDLRLMISLAEDFEDERTAFSKTKDTSAWTG